MNQPSVFQAQYPLSPKKFWKKIISKIIAFVFMSVVFGGFIGIIYSGLDFDNVSGWAMIYGILGVLVILFATYGWYVKAYIKRYYYDCGDQFITIKKGVFAPTEIHVQYQKIQDVYVDQDILDRIMGLYDVHIASATATSGIEAHIDGVDFEVAENLKNIILAKIHTGGSAPASAPTSQPIAPAPVEFTQKISSVTYPISGKWIVSAMGRSLFSSLIYCLIFFRIFSVVGLGYAVLVFVVIFFLQVIYLALWKKNFYFEFTPDYILLRTGVISRSENHLPYKSIQDILKKQSIIDRILGLSTVTIQNAAQQTVVSRGRNSAVQPGINLVWQPKEKAEELNSIVNDIVKKISPQNSSVAMGV